MQGGGQRVHRIRFDRRETQADDYGNTVNAWQMIATVWCGVDTQRRGRKEAVEAGRLESTIGWKITVLRSDTTKALRPDDRGVFTVGPHVGRVANIIAIEASADSREMILDCEIDIAQGNELALSPIPPVAPDNQPDWATTEW